MTASASRTAEPLEHQVARHFEEEITEEKDAGAPAEHGRGEAEILVHLERSEADIDAVEVADEVAEGHERHDPPADLADDPRFHGFLPDADAHYRGASSLPSDPAAGPDLRKGLIRAPHHRLTSPSEDAAQ